MNSDILSDRAKLLKPSPTLALSAKAKELTELGKPVINLTVGEPDWQTPDVISDAGIDAIQKGHTKYTPAAGILSLRKTIAESMNSQFHTQFKPNHVVVGTGAKFILYSVLQMICNPGDEVIVPAPYWVSYPTMIELAGGKPVIVETNESSRFKMTAKQLQDSITSKTKALVLCSPNNPTGIMYSKEELRLLADVLLKYPNILVISDDIYNQLTFDDSLIAPHLSLVEPKLIPQIFFVNGASKSFAMTGWRIGWAAGPDFIMNPLADLVSQTTSNASSISQYAALKGLQAASGDVELGKQKLISRSQKSLKEFSHLKYFQVIPPDGAFYFWVKVTSLLGKSWNGQLINSDKQVAEILLNELFLATVPGSEFGTSGYLRFSIAVSEANLSETVSRLKNWEQQLG